MLAYVQIWASPSAWQLVRFVFPVQEQLNRSAMTTSRLHNMLTVNYFTHACETIIHTTFILS